MIRSWHISRSPLPVLMIKRLFAYEKASSPSKRLRALLKLQEEGFDVTLRLSPLIEEYLDFDYLNRLPVDKVLVVISSG